VGGAAKGDAEGGAGWNGLLHRVSNGYGK
jgi:hypothetical protein